MNDGVIQATGLEKSFGPTEALRGVDLEVGSGEVVAVTGPSGSGKSTLLLALAGIVPPDRGVVRIEGHDLGALSETERTTLRRRTFGVVLQFGQLVPELTVLQNVSLPLLLEGVSRAEAEERAGDWLARFEVQDKASQVPGELSGGQGQRVAAARAMVGRPTVVFADEPTGAMDVVAGERLVETMLGAAHETGSAVVLVTHENRVAAYAHREIRLRDGRVVG